ncbi:hypothetical protein ACIPRI_02940 [Variovorax sp. LARHSF232]
MNYSIRIGCSALLAAGSLLAASSAIAAGPSGRAGAGGSQYQAERALCDNIQQDRAACIREAGAAQQAARQGALTNAPTDVYRNNALARCQVQPAEDRTACEDRVLGTGVTSIDGSVLGGGAIRETVTPIPSRPQLN